MIKVAVHGAAGKLGSRIVSLIQNSKDINFAGIIDSTTIPICDVIVDVTSDLGVSALIPRLSGQKLIVGTTGNLPYENLKKYAEKTTVYIVPNFSQGVQVTYKILGSALENLNNRWKVSIEETHHIHKKDKPSGTAKKLEDLVKQKGFKTNINSIREGDIIGIHKITFHNEFEKIEISHESFSRDVYASGCIEMIKKIMQEKDGYFVV